jgi:AcrR family transcriptional regulator
MTADGRRAVIVEAATRVFAEKGYRGASIEEIARLSGVTPPVVYDHFASKQELYQELLEIHYADLREIWFQHASSSEEFAVRLPRAIGAWFAYVETHPYAGEMLFHDATGDPDIEAAHRAISNQSRAALLPLLAREAGVDNVDIADGWAVEMAWESLRSVLQGLALWWFEHPEVPRERVVGAAINAIWIGFERLLRSTEPG